MTFDLPYVYVEEAKDMPLVRMEAYLMCVAIELNTNNNYSWGTRNGTPYLLLKTGKYFKQNSILNLKAGG